MNHDQRAQAERLAAEAVAELKAAGVLRPAPSLLELTYRDVGHLARQGAALFWLLDQLHHHWANRPDAPLSDVLKTEPRDRLVHLARELGHVGLHDLDDLLLPDPGTEKP